MNRLEQRFRELRDAGRKGLIPYVTAGVPEPADTVSLMHALAEAGADVIELGMPFSDPMADGPVIQKACERALAKGVRLKHVLDMVREFRAGDAATPLVLMGYLNPLERYGAERFLEEAADAGVDGLLIVDLPPEEGTAFAARAGELGLSLVRLAAPTTSDKRMALIAGAASGFIYYVSLKGVTGAANLDLPSVRSSVERLRAVSGLPIAVGFGVKDSEGAVAVANVADAVVIGSALLSAIAGCNNLDAARDAAALFLRPIRRALDEPTGEGAP